MYEVKGKDGKSQETRTCEEDALKRSEGLGTGARGPKAGGLSLFPKHPGNPRIHASRKDRKM